mmetsp:Transcript_23610/g.50369  ORF Transcript_23610/g.50369 Transcript_23610/m.50369 type:complete len:533 (-) Transcript_23610:508-2106(-)
MHTAMAIGMPVPGEMGREVTHAVTAVSTSRHLTSEMEQAMKDLGVNFVVPVEAYKEAGFVLSTFAGHDDLFRGTPLSCVMRNCGRIWKNSSGSADTYHLSHPVEVLRTFISHNWSVGRFQKYIALCLHFNLGIAAAAALSATVVLTLLHILGVIPCYEDKVIGGPHGPAPSGWAVRVIVPFIFVIAFFFGREIVSFIGFKGPDVFLDKVCIHQTDIAIQQQGILRLGAFLNYSDEMLVLYTNIYLRKLWTIFEVAAFLVLRPRYKMKVVPVNMAMLYIGAICFTCTGPLNVVVCRAYDLQDLLGVALTLVYNVIYIFILRRWRRDRQAIQDMIQAFSVHSALCAVESDRPIVCSNIVTLMKAHELVRADADDTETLEEFDKLVRSDLPQAFEKSFGKYLTFSYRQVLLRAFFASMTMGIDSLGGLGEADSTLQARQLIASALNNLSWGLLVVPTLMATQELLASCKLHLSGWKDLAIAVCIMLFSCWAVPLLQVFDYMLEEAAESNAWMAALIALNLVSMTMGSVFMTRLFR